MPQTTSYSVPESASQGLAEKAMDLGEQAVDRATEAAATARDTVKEHPIATLTVVAGLAFAVGAIWKMGQTRQHTRVDSLLSRLGELQNQLPRRWRM
jgi:hypothetical protein